MVSDIRVLDRVKFQSVFEYWFPYNVESVSTTPEVPCFQNQTGTAGCFLRFTVVVPIALRGFRISSS
jgi:hypothetical protein